MATTTQKRTLYPRTAITAVFVIYCIAFRHLRIPVWHELLPFFEWMETTWFGVANKTWDFAFATVEAFHLLGLALLGGSVIAADGRLLGFLLRDVPLMTVVNRCHRLFVIALLLLIATGIFMACGVAMKIYYLPVYWYKMLALTVGILHVFFIRRPLLKTVAGVGAGAAGGAVSPNALAVKLTAVSSLMIWFTVAATGRWIGYSG